MQKIQILIIPILWGALRSKWENTYNLLTEHTAQVACSINVIKLLLNIKTGDNNWSKRKTVILIMEELFSLPSPSFVFSTALSLSRNHITDLFIYKIFICLSCKNMKSIKVVGLSLLLFLLNPVSWQAPSPWSVLYELLWNRWMT